MRTISVTERPMLSRPVLRINTVGPASSTKIKKAMAR